MTAITATPNTGTGSVTLEIAQTSSVTRVTRSNADGINDVRVAAGQLPSAATGTTIITDYEAAHGINTYNAYVTDVATRTNLVINPSVEVNINGYGAETGTGGVVSGSLGTSGGAVGQNFYRATWTTGNASGPAGPTYSQSTSISGTTADRLSLGVWVRSSTSRSMILELALINSGTGNTWVDSVAYSLTANQWTYLKLENVVPNGAFNQVYIWAYSTTPISTGTTIDMDGLLLEKAATLGPYFDGATAPVTDVAYAWTGTANASTSTETTTTRQVTASTTLTIDKPWLLVPIAPNYSAQIESIPNYSAARETNSTVHTIIGRADPLVVLGKLGLRSGTLEIWTASLESASNLARVFDRGEAVFLKQTVSGMDMYFVAESLDVDPYEAAGDLTRYRFTVRYRELTRPYGNLAGALGWTFDALAATYSSFDAVSAAFANFDDLTIGDTL